MIKRALRNLVDPEPIQFQGGLRLWYSARYPATMFADDRLYANSAADGVIASLRDLSPYRSFASQTTDANRPLYKTAIGGHPAFLFDGTNDSFAIPNPVTFGTSDWTVYTAHLQTNISGDRHLLGGTATNALRLFITDGSMFPKITQAGISHVMNSTHALAVNTWNVCRFRRSGTTYGIKVNRFSEETVVSAGRNFSAASSNIGTHAAGGYMIGAIGDLVAYVTPTWSAAQQAQFEEFLLTTYGL